MKIFAGIILFMYMVFYINGASATIVYKSSVDYDYGFYKVIGSGLKPASDSEPESTYFVTVNYRNKTLTINQGDTVSWTNYDPKDWSMTIVSEQGLWGGDNSYLKQSYRTFSHTFNESGIYGIHIREDPELRQIVIVNTVETPVPKMSETQKPIEIPTSIPEQTQVPIVPVKTEKETPGFETVLSISTILLVLYMKNRKK